MCKCECECKHEREVRVVGVERRQNWLTSGPVIPDANTFACPAATASPFSQCTCKSQVRQDQQLTEGLPGEKRAVAVSFREKLLRMGKGRKRRTWTRAPSSLHRCSPCTNSSSVTMSAPCYKHNQKEEVSERCARNNLAMQHRCDFINVMAPCTRRKT
jgi:hypothetical protein